MDQGVSKRLRACIVGHSFVRRLGESLECEARWDGTDACVGSCAPGLLRVDDVYNEVWTLGIHAARNQEWHFLHREPIPWRRNPQLWIERPVWSFCGHRKYRWWTCLLRAPVDCVVWSESCVHSGSRMARQVPSSERCRVKVPFVAAQPCCVCQRPAIWREPFQRHEGILALPWRILWAARVRMVPRWNPPQLFRRCPEIPA